jgi:hypothetical protein
VWLGWAVHWIRQRHAFLHRYGHFTQIVEDNAPPIAPGGLSLLGESGASAVSLGPEDTDSDMELANNYFQKPKFTASHGMARP